MKSLFIFLALGAAALAATPAPTPAPTSANTSSSGTCSADSSCESLSCDAGYEPVFSPSALTISCEQCTYNFYKNSSGTGACSACADDKVSGLGATECVCPALYYMDANGDCQKCPDGVICTEMGQDISDLTLYAGYWRLSSTSSEVLECPESSACVGGNLTTLSSSSSSSSSRRRRLSTTDFEGNGYCATGYTGILCAVCEDGYYSVGSNCNACGAGNKAAKIIAICILGGALLLFVILVLRGQQMGDLDNDATPPASSSLFNSSSNGNGCVSGAVTAVKKKADTLVVKAKIIITHIQIVVQLPSVLNIALPQTFTRFAEAFNILNFDFWGILSEGCFFQSNFYKQLVSVTFMPIGIIGLLFLNYFIRRKRARRALRGMWDATISGVLLTTFFFYAAVSTTILQTFNCQQFDDGTRYLVADYSISCDTKKYKAFAAYAGVMVAVFPLGVPLIYVILLFKDRSKVSPPLPQPQALELRSEEKSVQYTKFLWDTYRPKAYLFEAWECVRKLLLTGLLVYFKQGTPTQIVIALLIALLGMRVLTAFRPFKRKEENSLAESSMWVLFFTLFSALLIGSGITETDGYNEAALGVVMSLLNIGLLVLAVLQTFWSASIWLSDQLEALSGGGEEQPKPKSPPRTAAENNRSQPKLIRSPVAEPPTARRSRGGSDAPLLSRVQVDQEAPAEQRPKSTARATPAPVAAASTTQAMSARRPATTFDDVDDAQLVGSTTFGGSSTHMPAMAAAAGATGAAAAATVAAASSSAAANAGRRSSSSSANTATPTESKYGLSQSNRQMAVPPQRPRSSAAAAAAAAAAGERGGHGPVEVMHPLPRPPSGVMSVAHVAQASPGSGITQPQGQQTLKQQQRKLQQRQDPPNNLESNAEDPHAPRGSKTGLAGSGSGAGAGSGAVPKQSFTRAFAEAAISVAAAARAALSPRHHSAAEGPELFEEFSDEGSLTSDSENLGKFVEEKAEEKDDDRPPEVALQVPARQRLRRAVTDVAARDFHVSAFHIWRAKVEAQNAAYHAPKAPVSPS